MRTFESPSPTPLALKDLSIRCIDDAMCFAFTGGVGGGYWKRIFFFLKKKS